MSVSDFNWLGNAEGYIYLIARGTVDDKILKALQTKADLARTIIDDYKGGNNPFIVKDI